MLAFIVYALSGHSLDPAIIFTSLSLFGLLRQPLMFMPRSLSAFTDGQNALSRMSRVLLADTLRDAVPIDPNLSDAVIISDADFQWETTPDRNEDTKARKGKTSPNTKAKEKVPVESKDQLAADVEPFALRNVNITVPRGGKVYAIVGPVGAGKSSLLQGMLMYRNSYRFNPPLTPPHI